MVPPLWKDRLRRKEADGEQKQAQGEAPVCFCAYNERNVTCIPWEMLLKPEMRKAMSSNGRSQILMRSSREEVKEILAMFIELKKAPDAITDRAGILEGRIEFDGFDGNGDDEYREALRDICCGLPYGILGDIKDLDSRTATTVRRYQCMVNSWKASRDRIALTKADLVRITNVRI